MVVVGGGGARSPIENFLGAVPPPPGSGPDKVIEIVQYFTFSDI